MKFSASFILALALVVVIASGALTDLSLRTHAVQAGIGSIRDEGLGGGTVVNLTQAEAMTRLPLLLPSVPLLASLDSITKVWARSGSPAQNESPDILVEYGTGVSAELRFWDLASPPVDHWHALMSDGLPGSIIRDSGVDMYVMPPGARGSGSVNFVENGTWVSVYGDGILSAYQLQILAESAVSQAG